MNRLLHATGAPFKHDEKVFIHPTPPMSALELIKTIVAACTLLPIRLILASTIVVLYALVSVFTIGGATHPRGLPYWIHRTAGKLMMRTLLFVLGFHFVEQRGTRDPRAKTLVANHAGYVDIVVMMALCFPAFVAKAGTKLVPFVGHVAKTMQCIFVTNDRQKRGVKSSGKRAPQSPGLFNQTLASISASMSAAAAAAASALLPASPEPAAASAPNAATGSPTSDPPQGRRRGATRSPRRPVKLSGAEALQARQASLLSLGALAADKGLAEAVPAAVPTGGAFGWLHSSVWPLLARAGLLDEDDLAAPVLVFAEGTTTNGADLVQFRSGAFLTDAPVQPVVITYHWSKVSPSWESVPNYMYALRMLTQLSHAVTVTYLPAVSPAAKPSPSLPSSMLVPDPAALAFNRRQHDPNAFAALVRRNIRQYLALQHHSEAGDDGAAQQAPPSTHTSRLVVPLPGTGLPLPPAWLTWFRRAVYGSGFLWFQPTWSSHATTPTVKWQLHQHILEGRLTWQWWANPHSLPLAADGLCTTPSVGGMTGVVASTLASLLPPAVLQSPWLATVVYAPAAAEAWLQGNACALPGYGAVPAQAPTKPTPRNSASGRRASRREFSPTLPPAASPGFVASTQALVSGALQGLAGAPSPPRPPAPGQRRSLVPPMRSPRGVKAESLSTSGESSDTTLPQRRRPRSRRR